jgi:hypothetical protein
MGAFLASVLLALGAGPEGETSARWSCEPTAVEVGQPFALVLELEHESTVGTALLAPRAPELDPSWVVFGAEPVARAPLADGRVRTRCVWHVASLEPGERSLADALSGLALGEAVTRIQVGDARVSVAGVLAQGEDAARPLRGFPVGFADAATRAAARTSWPALLAAGLALGAALSWAWVRARRRRARARMGAAPLPLERLAALEAGAAEAGRERCYELTSLLREAGDRLTKRPRAALTDEEWLATVHASLEIPRGVVAELTAVFERVARVKYAGESPTEWALAETFTRARRALQALEGGTGT